MKQIKHQKPSGYIYDRFDLKFDAEDRLVGIDSFSDGNSSHTYDSRDQLLKSDRTGSDLDDEFTYDASGNRLLKKVGPVASTNVVGSPFQQNRLLEDAVSKFVYDKEGNLIAKIPKSADPASNNPIANATVYDWDYRNRLVEVRRGTISFTSDASANRVPVRDAQGNIIVSSTTQRVDLEYDSRDRLITYGVDPDGAGPLGMKNDRFVYDGDEIYLQFSEYLLTNRYIGGSPVDQVLIDEVYQYDANYNLTNRSPRFLLGDHQDSVRTVVDGTGNVAQRMEYSAFGELIRATPSTGSTSAGTLAPQAVDELFRYTGRPYFDEIDLQNNRARWYDADNARFISNDPTGYAGGDYNLYRYVANSPLTHTDPTGLYGQALASAVKTVSDWIAPVAPVTGSIGHAVSDGIRAASSTYQRTASVGAAFSEGFSLFSSHFSAPTYSSGNSTNYAIAGFGSSSSSNGMSFGSFNSTPSVSNFISSPTPLGSFSAFFAQSNASYALAFSANAPQEVSTLERIGSGHHYFDLDAQKALAKDYLTKDAAKIAIAYTSGTTDPHHRGGPLGGVTPKQYSEAVIQECKNECAAIARKTNGARMRMNADEAFAFIEKLEKGRAQTGSLTKLLVRTTTK